MIPRRKLPELGAYFRAESQLPIRSGSEYRSLVVPNGNATLPVHRWFKYKEAFSADLLAYVLTNIDLDRGAKSAIRLLDPFCGVGTSLVSAQLLDRSRYNVRALGVECNPFAAFVARTKAAWPAVRPSYLRRLAGRLLAGSNAPASGRLPELSSIRTGRCISKHAAHHVLLIKERLDQVEPSVERDTLLVGLASCIEAVSKVRRDGRALRLTTKPRVILRKLLADRWESMAADIEQLQELHPTAAAAKVVVGDGRKLSALKDVNGSIDLILTSPPYPNNIDYNEVYKLELWLLGFVESEAGFLGLRRNTYRSHPTCSPLDPAGDTGYESFSKILRSGPLAELVSLPLRRAHSLDRQKARGRSKVLKGYLYDTWLSMQAHRRALRSGGRAVYVVGNSLHGGPEKPYLIPTDLILASLGQMVGLHTEQVVIARPLQRRLAGNHFLRDSILVFRKP